jgi:hypothetical protein
VEQVTMEELEWEALKNYHRAKEKEGTKNI